MPEEIGLFEAMHTQRAIRYFRPDPVPEELVRKILEAGIRAPSPVNKQDWAFIVIRDREVRERIAEHWRAARLTQITPDMTPPGEEDLPGGGDKPGPDTTGHTRAHRRLPAA